MFEDQRTLEHFKTIMQLGFFFIILPSLHCVHSFLIITCFKIQHLLTYISFFQHISYIKYINFVNFVQQKAMRDTPITYM